MANNNAVVNAILSATQNPQIQAAMLLGSRMESSWSTTSVGDQGTSFGPFQIHLPAHPGVSSGEAEDPVWAVHYMLPAYTAGVASVPASLWGSNPALAAATAAFHAERPAKMYANSTISADWPLVVAALGGSSAAVSSGSGTGATATASTTSSSIVGDLSVTFDKAYVGMLILLGLAMMSVGFYLLFRDALKGSTVINVTLPKGTGNVNAPKPTPTEPRAPRAQRHPATETRRPTVRPVTRLSPRPTRPTSSRVQPTTRVIDAPTGGVS